MKAAYASTSVTALLKRLLLASNHNILEWYIRLAMSSYSLLDWIYPPRCIACNIMLPILHNVPKQHICNECQPLFEQIVDPFCPKCGYPENPCSSCYGKSHYFDSHRAAYVYEETMREIILKVKFQSRRQAAQGLGVLFAEVASKWEINVSGSSTYIVPIPLHPSKKRARGFNQATVIARPLAKALNIPLCENMLKRIKNTTAQSLLSPHARAENLEGAFLYNSKKFKMPPECVVLIDDIYTSGATMDACAKILKSNGISRVLCFSLSIATKKMKKG